MHTSMDDEKKDRVIGSGVAVLYDLAAIAF